MRDLSLNFTNLSVLESTLLHAALVRRAAAIPGAPWTAARRRAPPRAAPYPPQLARPAGSGYWAPRGRVEQGHVELFFFKLNRITTLCLIHEVRAARVVALLKLRTSGRLRLLIWGWN